MSEGTSKRGDGRASKAEGGSKRARKSRKEPSLNRAETLGNLASIMKLANEKLSIANTSNSHKQRWSRIMIQACAAAQPILKDLDLDALKTRIEALEKVKKSSQ